MKFSEIILIFILIMAAISFSLLYGDKSLQKVCFKDNCLSVEIADEPNERTQGLMFREKMDSDKGMLFIFENEWIYPFWMKDTILPLDIIWMNSDKEIVFIKKNDEPYNTIPINPQKSALYVLEINAGESENLDLDIGNMASFIGIE